MARILLFVLGAVIGAICGLAPAMFASDARSPLKAWHLVRLDSEYKAGNTDVRDLKGYLGIEGRLFAQLDREVYAKTSSADHSFFNRYSRGSRADARSRAPDWNRTVELASANARGGVVLVHGLTDSPYSMRSLAEWLNGRGYWVLAIRLPGHGAAPSGLIDVQWSDWAAAVRLAARHVAQAIGNDKPLYMVGYSTGAALTLEYALSAHQGEQVPKLRGLVLLSPAVGLSPMAAFAGWRVNLAALPGLAKLAWLDVYPEFDPYKFNSFPVNAADQIYQLTRRVQSLLDAARSPSSGLVAGLPPILAFQSAADATVSVPAVVDTLMRRLASEGHELVIFDINRLGDGLPFLLPEVHLVQRNLLEGAALPFHLTFLANANAETRDIVELRRPASSSSVASRPTALQWERGVFSLSHTALPVSPADPVYGAQRPSPPTLLYLGEIHPHGEIGLLAIPPDLLMRLRHNPFFSYVMERLETFLP